MQDSNVSFNETHAYLLGRCALVVSSFTEEYLGCVIERFRELNVASYSIALDYAVFGELLNRKNALDERLNELQAGGNALSVVTYALQFKYANGYTLEVAACLENMEAWRESCASRNTGMPFPTRPILFGVMNVLEGDQANTSRYSMEHEVLGSGGKVPYSLVPVFHSDCRIGVFWEDMETNLYTESMQSYQRRVTALQTKEVSLEGLWFKIMVQD